MTFKEHVQWCRRRAHEYVDRGEHINAVASMLSDLRKHDEVSPASVRVIAMAGLTCVDARSTRSWIDGCFPSVPTEQEGA